MVNRVKTARFLLSLTVFLMLFAVPVPMNAQPAVEQPGWSETLNQCASCHGADGKGMQEVQAPRLAGQSERYLAEQLRHFVKGRRGTHADDLYGQSMAASATMLDEATIMRLAHYYASLESVTLGTAAPQAAESPEDQGGVLYAANCAACHGPSAEGADVLYVPNLALLDAAYLRRQIEAYQKAWRGGANASTRAKGMRQMAFQFRSQDEIDEVVKYLTQTAKEPATGDVEL